MKSISYLRLLVFCFAFCITAPSPAAAWSLYAQEAQPTTPTAPPKKQDNKKQENKKQDKKNPPPSTSGTQPEPAPQPLFGGQVNLKSSRQSKDTATLGFNGLDPNGQVQKGFLAAAATSADVAKAQQLTRTGVTQAELTAFLQEGGLPAPAAAQKP